MDGREGADWPWCAGFASYVLKEACTALGVAIPLTLSFSCDLLAASAKERGSFLGETEATAQKLSPEASF
jgi:hypothetical protein